MKRKMTRLRQVWCVQGVLVAVACVGVVVSMGGCDTASGSGGAQPTATGHQNANANATATAPASASGPAVLGSSGQAFIATYGPLTSQSNAAQGDLHFKQYPGVALDFLIVQTGHYFGVTPGDADVYSITVAPPPDQNWTPTAAKLACMPFLPADAQHTKTVTTVDATSNKIDGSDDLYTSATLAKTFPASAFQDASQNLAPVGSFDVWYQYTKEGDTSQVAYCQILLGTQQTTG